VTQDATELIYAMPGNETLAEALGRAAGRSVGEMELRRFPDGECYVRLGDDVAGRAVALVCSLERPDEKFMPLAMAAQTARDLGATRINLVAPYLAYMRQDERFRPGEGVSALYFSRMLGRIVDGLVTVDPHLHRIGDLGGLFDIPTQIVSAASSIAGWVGDHIPEPVIVGPDDESAQWAEPLATELGVPVLVLDKLRRGDRDVSVAGHEEELQALRGRRPVVMDDIISTGRTMLQTLRHLNDLGLHGAVCVGIHGVFADDVVQRLRDEGASQVVTCSTIAHATNAIDVTSAIVDGYDAFTAGLAAP